MPKLSWGLSSLALALVFAASAQAQSAPARPDPLDAKVAVPAVSYRSPLSSYRPYTEQAVGSWREANETVNRVGGWRTYAREAREPAPATAPASAPKPADPSMPAGHGGHKMQ
jgi:hypothetical protein